MGLISYAVSLPPCNSLSTSDQVFIKCYTGVIGVTEILELSQAEKLIEL